MDYKDAKLISTIDKNRQTNCYDHPLHKLSIPLINPDTWFF